jgi:hypothetical protein
MHCLTRNLTQSSIQTSIDFVGEEETMKVISSSNETNSDTSTSTTTSNTNY